MDSNGKRSKHFIHINIDNEYINLKPYNNVDLKVFFDGNLNFDVPCEVDGLNGNPNK